MLSSVIKKSLHIGEWPGDVVTVKRLLWLNSMNS